MGNPSTLTLILFNKNTPRSDSYARLTTNTAAKDCQKTNSTAVSKVAFTEETHHLYTPHPAGLHSTQTHSAGRSTPKSNFGNSALRVSLSPTPCSLTPNLSQHEHSSTQRYIDFSSFLPFLVPLLGHLTCLDLPVQRR